MQAATLCCGSIKCIKAVVSFAVILGSTEIIEVPGRVGVMLLEFGVPAVGLGSYSEVDPPHHPVCHLNFSLHRFITSV